MASALTYFVDGNFEPVVGGDTYAKLDDINLLMNFSERWSTLTETTKDLYLSEATLRINQLQVYGEKYDAAQPLLFPRQFNDTDAVFSLEEQAKRLLRACGYIIEHAVGRLPINITESTLAREMIIPRGQPMPREAKQALSPYKVKRRFM